MRFQIIYMGPDSPDEETFETEEEAIEYAFDTLPTDDTIYGILDTEENRYVCFVFQGEEWRPS